MLKDINIVNTHLLPNGDLTLSFTNRPLVIVLYQSNITPCTIYDIDQKDKEAGCVMFRGHFFISKDGTIYRGRPLNSLGEYAYNEDTNIDLNSNTLGLCIEGDFQKQVLGNSQKSSIIALIQALFDEYEDQIKLIYARDELLNIKYKDPAVLFPLNEIIAECKNDLREPIRTAPNGNIRYTLGGRLLFYEPKNIFEGNDVEQLQLMLSLLGFDIVVNSKFDNNTYTVLKNFQRSYALIPSGILDNDTINKLNSLCQQFTSPKDNFSRVLEYTYPTTMNGEDIKRVQTRLNIFGYECNSNGWYDSGTQEAISEYQRDHNIPEDGKIGPITWNKIVYNDNFSISRVLKVETPMMYGEDIRLVQQRLNDLGYNCGDPSGWYDSITANQIALFQQLNGLLQTGIVDLLTVKALFR